MRRLHRSPPMRTDNLEEALARMAFLIERGRPLGYLAGPAGVGKTTVLRLLADEIRVPGRKVVVLSAAGMTEKTLLMAITSELGLGRSGRCMSDRQSLLLDYLVGLSAIRESAALLIDDFEMADDSCIGLLSSLIRRLADSQAHVSMVATVTDTVSGAWRELGRSHAEFVVRLEPWTLQETAKYALSVIERHNRQSATIACGVDDSGIRALYDSSHGMPSRLERITELSLLACEALEESRLSAEIILGAAQELFPRSTLPSRPTSRPIEV